MNLRPFIFAVTYFVGMVLWARETRIYLAPESIPVTDSVEWVVPYRSHLQHASFEVRGCSTASPTEIAFLWCYDSVPEAPIHTALFTLAEPSDNIYGNSSPSVRISVDGEDVGTIDKGIASLKGENTLAIEFDFESDFLTLLAGSSYITRGAKLTIPADAHGIRFGIRGSRNWSISTAVAAFDCDPTSALATGLDSTAISALINTTQASPVGYWHYLDRDCNPDYARLGGEYTLAIIPDGVAGNYLILYIDGAVTAASRWHTGMIKGRLYATPFADHYNLTWYDALMTPYSSECSATLEQPSVLRLDLPLLKASIRLAALPRDN